MQYSKNELLGYYNDLTNKFLGKNAMQTLDDNGIPINQLSNGEWIYFATTIAQYGLGAYDVWLSTQSEEARNAFVRCSEWLVHNQDEHGGWKLWTGILPDHEIQYSSMPQREGASLLLRAGMATKNKTSFASAGKAIDLMLVPIEKGGTARVFNGEMILEEDPNSMNAILNGWLFLYLVYMMRSWFMIVQNTRRCSTKPLVHWKTNSNSTTVAIGVIMTEMGTLQVLFYHELHVSLLRVLDDLSGIEKFQAVALRWEQYSKNRVNYTRAFLRKAWQKITKPEEVVIVR